VKVGTSAEISTVLPDTPAARAGLRAGDRITAIDGTKISNGNELRSRLDSKQPGDKITVTYTRGGTSKTVKLTLVSRPNS